MGVLVKELFFFLHRHLFKFYLVFCLVLYTKCKINITREEEGKNPASSIQSILQFHFADIFFSPNMKCL